MGYIVGVGIVILLAALYYGGVLTLQKKCALVFIGTGSFKKRCIGASFTDCTGFTRRMLRVKESRSYGFFLSGHIQEGSVCATLQERGTPLVTLTTGSPTATVFLEKGKCYRLEVQFRNASGDYQLEWD